MSDIADDPRDELQQVERRLSELREELAALRREIGDRSDGPGDAVDNATLITTLETQEALVENLEGRRTELRSQLGIT